MEIMRGIVRSLRRLSLLYLLCTLWCVQADYEQELSLQRTAHKRELARSRDEVAQLLATAEASSVPVDEELVRRRYIKETERIKVRSCKRCKFLAYRRESSCS